jgi:hypothetical protein
MTMSGLSEKLRARGRGQHTAPDVVAVRDFLTEYRHGVDSEPVAELIEKNGSFIMESLWSTEDKKDIATNAKLPNEFAKFTLSQKDTLSINGKKRQDTTLTIQDLLKYNSKEESDTLL